MDTLTLSLFVALTFIVGSATGFVIGVRSYRSTLQVQIQEAFVKMAAEKPTGNSDAHTDSGS